MESMKYETLDLKTTDGASEEIILEAEVNCWSCGYRHKIRPSKAEIDEGATPDFLCAVLRAGTDWKSESGLEGCHKSWKPSCRETLRIALKTEPLSAPTTLQAAA